jgi:hypothetical protein
MELIVQRHELGVVGSVHHQLLFHQNGAHGGEIQIACVAKPANNRNFKVAAQKVSLSHGGRINPRYVSGMLRGDRHQAVLSEPENGFPHWRATDRKAGTQFFFHKDCAGTQFQCHDHGPELIVDIVCPAAPSYRFTHNCSMMANSLVIGPANPQRKGLDPHQQIY